MALEERHLQFGGRCQRDEPRAWNPGARDRDFAAVLYLFQQSGEMPLGFVDINGFVVAIA